MKHRYSLVRFLQVGAGLLFFLLLNATSAWAQLSKIYYTQGSSTATLDAAKVVNPDGSAGATLASAATSFSQPTDIVYDKVNGYIYLTDQFVGTGGILRFTTAGTGRTVIVPPTAGATYNGLALDATLNRLYFTQASATNPTLDALKMVSLATGFPVTTLASGAANFSQPTDLVLSATGTTLYVADQYTGTGAILSFTTAGAGRTIVVPATANANYNGLALDATLNRLYFTQGSATPALDALKYVALSTGVVTTLVSGAANFTQPTDLVYDGVGQLYLTDQFVGTGGILRFTTAGTGRTVIVPPTAGATYNGLAVAISSAPVVVTTTGNTAFTQLLPGPSVPVAIDGGVTVSDADNSTLASATVSITGNYQSSEDVLAFTNASMGNIAISSNTGGVLTLTSAGATATLAQWQAALRAVTYTNTAAAPNTGNRTISFVVNDGSNVSNAATKTVTLTRAAIVITSVVAPANGTYITGQNLNFTVNFNTSVTVNTAGGTPTLPFTLDTGGGVSATYVSGSGTSALVFRYTVASGNLDATGIALGTALVANGGTIRDAASQDAVLTLNGVPVTTGVLVDGVAPTVSSINRQTPAAALTNATTLVYRATFSESVNGVGPTDFSLAFTGTAAGTVASVSLISGGIYDITVNSVSGDGTLRLDLNSSGTGITDVPGNAISGGFTTGQAYTVDHSAPSVVISSTASNPTNTSPIPVTVTFSETVTGFVAADVTVGNGALSGFSGSGTTYTFNITPLSFGTVTVDVGVNSGQDAVGNGNTAAPQFSIQYVITTWTGNLSTDWFTNGNWTAGVPTASTDALIPAGRPNYPVLTTGTPTAFNLTLATGATLTQSAGALDLKGNFANSGTFTATGGLVSLTGAASQAVGGSSLTRFFDLTVGAAGATLSGTSELRRVLTLTGSLTTSGQSFTLLSSVALGDALVVNSGGVVTGAATVQRAIDPSLNSGLGYRHYSAPVSNSTVADLATAGFTPVFSSTYNTSATPGAVTPFPTVYGYDQSRLTLTNNTTAFDKGFFSPAALSDPLTVGRGYTVNIGASQLVDFVGSLNNGTQTFTLARNAAATANATDAGWQLLGNPYPAPLDYSLVTLADRPNLDASIYVFGSTSQYGGQYRAYVNNVGGNPVLPVGQGFFARVSAGQTSASLTLRNSHRLTVPNATTFRRTTAETRPLVKLTLRGAAGPVFDDAYVYFEAGATAGVDAQFDAVKLPNSTGLNLSSMAVGTQLAINGLPPVNTTSLTVPLFVGLPATGTYTLEAAQVLNFAPGGQPFLRDLQLGTLTDLSLQTTYTFTQNAASTTPRFELVFGAQQVLGTASAALSQQVMLYPNPATGSVSVALPAALGRAAVTAVLVDALGRVVRQQLLPASRTAHELSLTGIAAGVYALRLQTELGLVVKKLVVN